MADGQGGRSWPLRGLAKERVVSGEWQVTRFSDLRRRKAKKSGTCDGKVDILEGSDVGIPHARRHSDAGSGNEKTLIDPDESEAEM